MPGGLRPLGHPSCFSHSTFPLAKASEELGGGASLGGCSQGAGDQAEQSRGRQELSKYSPFGAHRMEESYFFKSYFYDTCSREENEKTGRNTENITLILFSGEKHLMLPFHSSFLV